MKLIVISHPTIFKDEAKFINSLFKLGLSTLHLRKPHHHINEVENLLKEIDSSYYSRIVIHDFFELTQQYPLKGIHLNGRRKEALYLSGEPIDTHKFSVSKSLHSIEEISENCFKSDLKKKSGKVELDYAFLSPIYDSISKEGYDSSFTSKELFKAKEEGLIHPNIIAMGGIDMSKLSEIKNFGFGGVSLLGDIWNKKENHSEFEKHFITLKNEITN